MTDINLFFKGHIKDIKIVKIDKMQPYYKNNLMFESIYWDNNKFRFIRIPINAAYDENNTFNKYCLWLTNPCNYCLNIIKKNKVDHTAVACPYHICKKCNKFGHNYYACN
jgi:hypothetical protein